MSQSVHLACKFEIRGEAKILEEYLKFFFLNSMFVSLFGGGLDVIGGVETDF